MTQCVLWQLQLKHLAAATADGAVDVCNVLAVMHGSDVDLEWFVTLNLPGHPVILEKKNRRDSVPDRQHSLLIQS